MESLAAWLKQFAKADRHAAYQFVKHRLVNATMATTWYFDEVISDQDGRDTLEVELGRSSFYSGRKLNDGQVGSDSIYLTVEGRTVIMDRATAKRFVDGVLSVGAYHGLLD